MRGGAHLWHFVFEQYCGLGNKEDSPTGFARRSHNRVFDVQGVTRILNAWVSFSKREEDGG